MLIGFIDIIVLLCKEIKQTVRESLIYSHIRGSLPILDFVRTLNICRLSPLTVKTRKTLGDRSSAAAEPRHLEINCLVQLDLRIFLTVLKRPSRNEATLFS